MHNLFLKIFCFPHVWGGSPFFPADVSGQRVSKRLLTSFRTSDEKWNAVDTDETIVLSFDIVSSFSFGAGGSFRFYLFIYFFEASNFNIKDIKTLCGCWKS